MKNVVHLSKKEYLKIVKNKNRTDYDKREDKTMKNTLGDLNNHLFEQMERLNDEELQGEALVQEITRSRAISDIAKQIINNANVVLNAKKAADDWNDEENKLPRLLEG